MKGKAHSDETKAAVMAALLTGQGVGEIAKAYKLPESTVRLWRESIPEDEYAKVCAKKEDDFGDLVGHYLRETLITLAVQVQQFRKPDWLEKQPASEAAVLHGVLTDKAIRLLEAAERGREVGAEQEP